jgi:hypothetical protein
MARKEFIADDSMGSRRKLNADFLLRFGSARLVFNLVSLG